MEVSNFNSVGVKTVNVSGCHCSCETFWRFGAVVSFAALFSARLRGARAARSAFLAFFAAALASSLA